MMTVPSRTGTQTRLQPTKNPPKKDFASMYEEKHGRPAIQDLAPSTPADITLIAPRNDYKGTFIVKLQNRVYPSLGLGYVAGSLEAAGYKVDYIDMFASNMSYAVLTRYFNEKRPKYIGITTNLGTIIPAKKVAFLARKANPGCKIIIGGINIGLFPHQILNTPYFDIGVVGEGEQTIVELLNALRNGQDLRNVKGIVFKSNGSIVQTEERKDCEDLDSIPFPARHLMPMDKYKNPISKQEIITTMMASRGCPFNCLFCVKAKSYHMRSPNNIVAEMEHLSRELGIKEVLFVDSTFTANKRKTIDVCKEIIRRKLSIIWEVSTRVDCVDEEILNWMKKAGCVRVQYGIESGDDRVLKMLRKGITTNQARRAMQITKKVGLETLNMFMIGSPGDDVRSIRRTIEFAVELDADYSVFIIASPSPGTDMFELAVKQGLTKEDVWEAFVSQNDQAIPRLTLSTKDLPRRKLDWLLKLAYLRFYFRPIYFRHRIRRITTFSELKNNLTGFINVIREITG